MSEEYRGKAHHSGSRLGAALPAIEKPRTLDIPADLAAAFKLEPKSRAIFDTMPYSHRKENIAYIEEAKKAGTRQRRILKVMQALQEKAGE